MRNKLTLLPLKTVDGLKTAEQQLSEIELGL
jgi:hypothetical protein